MNITVFTFYTPFIPCLFLLTHADIFSHDLWLAILLSVVQDSLRPVIKLLAALHPHPELPDIPRHHHPTLGHLS